MGPGPDGELNLSNLIKLIIVNSKIIVILVAFVSFISCDKAGSEKVIERWNSGEPRLIVKNQEHHIYYSELGIKESEGIFRNGKAEGIWIGYYDNGKIRMKSEFKNGENINRKEYFDKEGNLREYYEWNEIEGFKKYVTYYQNEILRSEGQYIFDKKMGLWNYFNKNGKLAKKEIYSDGGELIEEIEYEKWDNLVD